MSFDRLARHYHWMETALAGGRLQRARLAWVGATREPRRILLAGEGPGRFLVPALRLFPGASMTVVDASREMLRTAERAVHPSHRFRVEFAHGSFPEWTASAPEFDLLVTNFFLDCFGPGELPSVLQRLDGCAGPAAEWLLTDFAMPPAGWARLRARAIHALMYSFFRVTTRIPARSLAPPEPGLSALGWQRAHSREWEFGLIRSSLWRRKDSATGGDGMPTDPSSGVGAIGDGEFRSQQIVKGE